MYIEADAWATNLKQKLACGSVLMSAKMEFYEFFTRALKPDLHYVEVSTQDMCQDTARKVIAGPPFSDKKLLQFLLAIKCVKAWKACKCWVVVWISCLTLTCTARC